MAHVLAKELREAVLQAAMSGKLTEQLSTDTPVEETLKQIAKEKERLIKEKKIKKDKPLPEIGEDEVPFDIPENWIFVNLGEVITLLSGQDLPPTSYNSSNDGIPYITGASNFVNGNITINRWTTQPRSIATKGSLLLTCKGTIGETAFLSVDKAHIARQVMSISPISTNERYILHYLHFRIEELKKKAKSMIPGIERKDVLTSTFPLPPIEEQARIVAKVDELMAKIDEYEKLENQLVHLKEQFPKVMRDALLKAVMEGDLTSKDSEKKTYSLVNKEFLIPKNWKVKRMIDTNLTYANGNYAEKYPKRSELTIEKENHIPFLRANNIKESSICTSDMLYITKAKHNLLQRGHLIEGDLIVTIRGNIGNCGLVPHALHDANLNAQLTVIRSDEKELKRKYLLYLMLSPQLAIQIKAFTTGTALKQLSEKSLHSFYLPIPPVEEQARIVAKLDQLLPLVESLEVS